MLSLFSPVGLSLLIGCSAECCEPIHHPADTCPGEVKTGSALDVGSELTSIYDGVFSPLGIPTKPLTPRPFVAGMSACGTLTPLQLNDVLEVQIFGELVLPCCGDGSPHPVWQSGRRAAGCMAFGMHRANLGELVLPKARSRTYSPMSGFSSLGNVFITTLSGCVHAVAKSPALAAGVGLSAAGCVELVGYNFQSLESTALAGVAGRVLARSYQAGMRVTAGTRHAIRVSNQLAVASGHDCKSDEEQLVIKSAVSEQGVVSGWSGDHVIVCSQDVGAATVNVTLADDQIIEVKVHFV